MLNKNTKTVIRQALTRLVGRLNKGLTKQGTVEWVGAQLIFDPRESEIAYGHIRPFNKVYAEHEEDWYDSKDLCINGHPGIEDNKTWRMCATVDGHVNSNYGYLVYGDRSPGASQFEYAMKNLDLDYFGNSGRQSIIYYAGPEMQVWNNDGVHADHDFTCTISTQHIVTNGRLDYIVTQRSCDLVFGLTYDLYHHCRVYENMMECLRKRYGASKIKYGKIIYNFGSLHVYERHWDLIKEILHKYQIGDLK